MRRPTGFATATRHMSSCSAASRLAGRTSWPASARRCGRRSRKPWIPIPSRAWATLRAVDPSDRTHTDGPTDTDRTLDWPRRIWRAERPLDELGEFWRADPLAGAGMDWPAALLALRDGHRFQPWSPRIRAGY